MQRVLYPAMAFIWSALFSASVMVSAQQVIPFMQRVIPQDVSSFMTSTISSTLTASGLLDVSASMFSVTARLVGVLLIFTILLTIWISRIWRRFWLRDVNMWISSSFTSDRLRPPEISWPPPMCAGGHYIAVTVQNLANVPIGVYCGPAFEYEVIRLGGFPSLGRPDALFTCAHFTTYMNLQPAVRCVEQKHPNRMVPIFLW